MNDKTYCTAVVIIPPEECWEAIQAIRRVHDRNVRRWMPHITLLYPFVPHEEFGSVAPDLARACSSRQPFRIRFAEFKFFKHRQQEHTLWLSPVPAEPIQRLQSALQQAVPHCSDVSQFGSGFVPHLSVGQTRGKENLAALLQDLQVDWTPIEFEVHSIAMIRRNDPPDDIFRVERCIPIGEQ